MKARIVALIVLAAVVAAGIAVSPVGPVRAASGPGIDYGLDMAVQHARNYRAAQYAVDPGPDMEVVLAGRYRLARVMATARAYGAEVDLAVQHARLYRLERAAEAMRIAEASGR